MLGFYSEHISQFTGEPIVVCYSLKSSNTKTGDMITAHILPRDHNPLKNSKDKLDSNICGDCIHKQSEGGDCYVVLFRGPYKVWEAFNNGRYHKLNLNNIAHVAFLQTKPIRIGGYGDCAAIDFSWWCKLFSKIRPMSNDWTNYTNSWFLERVQPYKAFAMASVISMEEKEIANSLGWRTFRVIYPDDPSLCSDEALAQNEFYCPSTEEQGHRLTCAECKACFGTGGKKKPVGNVAIQVHGILKSRLNKQSRDERLNNIIKIVSEFNKEAVC